MSAQLPLISFCLVSVVYLPPISAVDFLRVTGQVHTIETVVSVYTPPFSARPALLVLFPFNASFGVNRASYLRTPHTAASGFLHSPRSVVPIGQA